MFGNNGDRPYLADVSKYTITVISRMVPDIADQFRKPCRRANRLLR